MRILPSRPCVKSITLLPSAASLRKAAQPTRSRSAFMRLVDLLASAAGRAKYRCLLRALNDDLYSHHAPRIVGVVR